MSQLWQLTHNGYLLPALNSSLALNVSSSGSITLQPLVQGNASQVWTRSSDAWTMLTNSATSQVISVVVNNLVMSAPKSPAYGQLFTQNTQFNCGFLLTTVTNTTSNNLRLSLNTAQSEGKCALGSGFTPLAANSSLTFWAQYNGGLASSVQIWDPNYSSSSSVASFITHQHNCVLKAGDVWVDNVNFIGGYTLAVTSTAEGSYADSLPGLVYMTLTN
jgi:hypothetical protein